MKTFLVLVALVGIASAVNLRVGSQLTTEEAMCQQARSHISFLKSQLSDCNGKYQSKKCAIIRSALSLLEESKKSDELKDEYNANEDERTATGEELEGAADAITDSGEENDTGLAAASKGSEELKNKEGTTLGGTRADGESVYEAGAHDGVIHTEHAKKRMDIIGAINVHMENVRNILIEFKKEHVDKCTEANKRLAARVVNQKEIQEEAFEEMAEGNEERAALAEELRQLEEKTVKQAENGEMYEDQLNNLVGNICEGVEWLDAYHAAVATREQYFAAVAAYDEKVEQMHETVKALTELFGSDDLTKCGEEVAKELDLSQHGIEEEEKDGVIVHLCKLHKQNFEGHRAFVEKHFGTNKNREWIELLGAGNNANLLAWVKEPAGTTPDFDKEGADKGPTTPADYLKAFIANDESHFHTFDVAKRCSVTVAAAPLGDDEPAIQEEPVAEERDIATVNTETEDPSAPSPGDNPAVDELEAEKALLGSD